MPKQAFYWLKRFRVGSGTPSRPESSLSHGSRRGARSCRCVSPNNRIENNNNNTVSGLCKAPTTLYLDVRKDEEEEVWQTRQFPSTPLLPSPPSLYPHPLRDQQILYQVPVYRRCIRGETETKQEGNLLFGNSDRHRSRFALPHRPPPLHHCTTTDPRLLLLLLLQGEQKMGLS